MFKAIEPTPKFSALRRGYGHISGIEAIPKLADERQALLPRNRYFIVGNVTRLQRNPKRPGTSALVARLRGDADVAANFIADPVKTIDVRIA